MEYIKETEEGFGFETEKVEWLNYEDAYEKLTNKKEKEILNLAFNMLKSNI